MSLLQVSPITRSTLGESMEIVDSRYISFASFAANILKAKGKDAFVIPSDDYYSIASTSCGQVVLLKDLVRSRVACFVLRKRSNLTQRIQKV